MLQDSLLKVDLITCKDLLGQLSVKETLQVLKNFKNIESTYILVILFISSQGYNTDAGMGNWCLFNLQVISFNFSKPLTVIHEHCSEGGSIYTDKSMVLWS